MAAATAALVSSQHALAAGFAVSAQSAYGMGNAYAGNAAVASDASTVLTNPAGIFELDGPVFGGSVSITSTGVDYENRGSLTNELLGAGPVSGRESVSLSSNSPAPSLYYARQLNDQWALGFGFNVPFATTSSYDDDWVGRYHAVDTEVRAFDFNPTVAYRINDKVSIGGGISVQFASANLTSKLDTGAVCFQAAAASDADPLTQAACANNGVTPNTVSADSDIELDGTGTAVTFNLGALFKPREGTKIGVAYRHGSQHKLKGDATFDLHPFVQGVFDQSSNPLFSETGTTISADLPATFDVSLAQSVNDKLELLGTLKWTQWSVFDQLTSDFDNPAQDTAAITFNWEDAIMFSTGLNYQVNNKFTLRAGFAFDQEPVPSPTFRSPRGAANDRYWYSIGGSYQFSKKLSGHFAVTHIEMDQAAIDNTGDSAGAPTLRGLYDFDVNLVGFQLNWHFI